MNDESALERKHRQIVQALREEIKFGGTDEEYRESEEKFKEAVRSLDVAARSLACDMLTELLVRGSPANDFDRKEVWEKRVRELREWMFVKMGAS